MKSMQPLLISPITLNSLGRWQVAGVGEVAGEIRVFGL